MSPTFDLGMDTDDVTEPQLIPEDWITVEIVASPEKQENKAMKDGGEDADNAGHNLVIFVKTTDCLEEFKGRPFWLRYGFPNPSDKGKFINGQAKTDWKVERMAKAVAAFLGLKDWRDVPRDFDLQEGMKASCYVMQTTGRDGQTPTNEVDTLNMAPRPVSGGGLSFGGEGSGQAPDNTVPF